MASLLPVTESVKKKLILQPVKEDEVLWTNAVSGVFVFVFGLIIFTRSWAENTKFRAEVILNTVPFLEQFR